MDNNKDPGSNLALWLPGGAVIISLVVSTFAVTREPFMETRPAGAQFQVEQHIEARLWQDPFDALERYRKNSKNSQNHDDQFNCHTDLHIALNGNSQKTGDEKYSTPEANIMVALVTGGPYGDEVELRRRTRYAILAGLKNSQLVPENEKHIGCLKFDQAILQKEKQGNYIEIPYETFTSNLPNTSTKKEETPKASQTKKTILFWFNEEYLGTSPLANLEKLHNELTRKVVGDFRQGPNQTCEPTEKEILKVIGPSSSSVLRHMYIEEDEINKEINKNEDRSYLKLSEELSKIEVYSPLATTSKKMLTLGIDQPSPDEVNSKWSMNLVRTISDDATLARLLLTELRRRRVDPVRGLKCSEKAPALVGISCDTSGWGYRYNRIALVSEWDSFYSRALAETFKSIVIEQVQRDDHPYDRKNVADWVLQFSYLRGLDGQLPGEPPSDRKSSDNKENNQRVDSPLDIGSLEKADGDSQLDYLRRLADHIAHLDKNYRHKGESGIGAIGVLGTDAYDKLLVLQALKSRMPNKVFFSTDLDARMLQRGQARTVRNLVLAAPYGLTLTRKLQQDVPPFRDSLQSAVFVAVLTALAPQSFEEKLAKFDYADSGLLSPGIYEVGTHGFIPLASLKGDICKASSGVRWRATGEHSQQDIMQLPCLQDKPPPPYPELSETARDTLDRILSIWWAKPLSLILLGLAIFLGWWWTAKEKKGEENYPADVRDLLRLIVNLPLALYLVAALSAWFALWLWRVELLWVAFLLILLGIICSNMISRQQHDSGLFDSPAYYTVVPIVVFLLALLWAYQQRQLLTEEGLGEPMFLFEGISAWPTLGLRLLAVLISISALAWGWLNLRTNGDEIEKFFLLNRDSKTNFWRHTREHNKKPIRKWLVELGYCLFRILFPLSPICLKTIEAMTPAPSIQPESKSSSHVRTHLKLEGFWKEHIVCGTFAAGILRASLATWIFVVVTSALFVLWPMEGTPMRGELQIGRLGWMVPTLAFQLLVFWVADANRLLVRFIRLLSSQRLRWPSEVRRKYIEAFAIDEHPCIDDWLDMTLIAQRSKAVSRLIYAPTVVLLILIMSRSSVFDNWPTPPSMIISFILTALVLFISALSLRRAAEKARGTALQRIDEYLLKTPDSEKYHTKFHLIRERIAALNTGAFSRYTEEPLVRALLLSLAGIGGSVIVEVLNYSKF